MESTIDFLRFREREDFIASFRASFRDDAIAAQRECQSVFRWVCVSSPTVREGY